MLKLKKIFSVGLAVALAAAMGMFVTSCVEPVDKYSVTIESGITGQGDSSLTTQRPGASGGGSYEEGETVTIVAGTAPTGKVFDRWTSGNADVVFADSKSPTTSFVMPASDVRVAAWFKDGTVVNATYIVTLVGGVEHAYVANKNEFVDGEDGPIDPDFEFDTIGEFEAGDTVVIFSGYYDEEDLEFINWTNTGAPLSFNPSASSCRAYFVMPARDVTVTANWDVIEWPEANVRFTWEAEQLPNIYMISASFDDVNTWYTDVWEKQYEDLDDEELALLHVSHIPFNKGSTQVANNLYSNFNMETVYDTTHKAEYFEIDNGAYTAICTVIDPSMKDTFDIVANYEIATYVDAVNIYIEVGFDVGLYLDMEDTPGADDPDNWIVMAYNDNPDTAPVLAKTQTKHAAKFLKKLKKDNVTYYVFKRAKK